MGGNSTPSPSPNPSEVENGDQGTQLQSNEKVLGTPEESDIPEGGFAAWATVAGAWLVLFATFGYVYAFGVYQDFYVRVYLADRSPSTIAWIGSVQLMMPFALGIISGKLLDEGYFYVVEIVGSTIFVVSLFMLSLAKPNHFYQIFLSQAIGMGIGLGLTFVPTVGVTAHYFRRHRNLASGIALSGSSAGALVFPIMLNHLIPKIGFAKGVRASAYIVLGFLVIGNCLMRTRLPPRSKRPEARNAAPVNIKGFFTDPAYMLSTLGALVSSFGFYFPVIFLQLYSVLHNIDNKLAFYSLAIVNGTGIIGRVLGTHAADVIGPYNVLIVCTVAVGASVWGVLGITDRASLIVISIIYGISAGAYLALAITCLGSLARGPEEVGARVGIALGLSSFGSLGSAPAQGAMLTSKYLWRRPIAFSGSVMFATLFIFIAARSILARRRKTWRV